MPKIAPKAATPAAASAEVRRHELVLPPHAGGLRLDQALSLALPQYSRSRLAAWIKSGSVRLDGKAARPRDAVYGGESVRVEASLPPDESVAPERMPIKVAYRDKHLFVIDKPAGLVVHPGAGNRASTLQNGLLALDPKLATVPRAGIVHRIDKDTSGLLVVARSLEAHTALVQMLREHQVQREYQALCVGAVTGGGTVDAPIGRHRTDRLKMAVRPDGKSAVTHYRLAERFAHHTLLHVQLETGRTHQIRVHLAHVGHPLVGDPLYGGRRQLTPGATPALREALKGFGRQALHAGRLAFEHPLGGKAIDISSPLPADFRRLLGVLREARMSPGSAFVLPEWPAPPGVRAISTTRRGGISAAPWNGLNLGEHVGDTAAAVAANRHWLREAAASPEPVWLTQVHGIDVADLDLAQPPQRADAAVSATAGRACVVMTADCLPVVLASSDGAVVGVAHAGWRGLAAGVVEATIAVMRGKVAAGTALQAWLAPAIGPANFEVGDEVRSAFLAADDRAQEAFTRNAQGRWQCDLYRLARQRLVRAGVERISGGGRCTYAEAADFYSHRRDVQHRGLAATGRMATLIWRT